MADFVGAVDQGTTSTRFMIFDHGGNEVARHQLEHQPDPAAGGLGRARPGGDLGAHQHGDPERPARRRPDRRPTSPRSASPTSARPRSSGTRAPAGRTTTRSSGRTPAPTGSPSALERDGHGDVIRRKAGLPPATYFSGGKIQWILENVDGVREAAEAGDALFGNTDSLGAVEPHRRPGRRRPRHRRDQRQPHHADGPGDPGLGRRAARRSSASRGAMLPEINPVLRTPRRTGSTRASRPAASGRADHRRCSATSRRPPSARSASRPARRRTPTAPATSCCSTPARSWCVRSPGC